MRPDAFRGKRGRRRSAPRARPRDRTPRSGAAPRAVGGGGLAAWGYPALIAALGLLLRLLFILDVRHHPLVQTATADPRIYDERALEILRGQWLGSEAFFHSSPLYPYLLAGIYAIFGHSYLAVRLIQSFAGVGTALLIYAVATRAFGRWEGRIAGLLAAVYMPFVFFDSELLEITFVLLATMLALYLLLTDRMRASPAAMLVAGLSLGVGVLGKPNLLLFVPVAVVWMLWRAGRPEIRLPGGRADASRAPGGGRPGGDPARARRLPAAALVTGVALAVAPFTISNIVTAGDFVLTSSNGGINFYIGNHAAADGTFQIDHRMRTDLFGGSQRIAEEALGRELKPSEVSSYWFRQGLSFLSRHPLQALELWGRKFLLFWNGFEIPNHYSIPFFQKFSRVLRWNPIGFHVLIPLGVVGIAIAGRRSRASRLLLLFAATYLVSLMPFFVTSRYRLPIIPIMIIFAGVGAVWLIDLLRRRGRLPGRLVPLLLLHLAIVVTHLPIIKFTHAHQYALLGSVHRDRGEYAPAAQAYRQAIAEQPWDDAAHLNLGSVLGRMGQYEQAEAALLRARDLNPAVAATHSNLGMVYLQTGRLEDARDALRQAIHLDPQHRPAWENLLRVSTETGDWPEAVRACQALLQLDPRDGNAHWNLAMLLSRDPARAAAAAEHARQAGALLPGLRPQVAALLELLEQASSPAAEEQ
jgi:tetratricopeptide (TPR) repeat protein